MCIRDSLQEAGAVDTVFSSGFQNYAFKDGKFVEAWGLKGYVFGTDDMGRDVFNRLMNGGKMTMTIGGVAVLISTFIGIIVGCVAGYFGGKVDIALMRVLPGMTVISPADAVEAVAALKAALEMTGPCYLRFGRYAVPVLHDPDTYRFEIGKGEVLRDGSDVTIVANGILVSMALTAADTLAAEGISARVINIHTVKPLDTELLCAAAAETGAVVTAEEHNIIGGLGSAVAETLAENCPVPMVRVGVRDSFGRSGKVPELLALYGLTPEALCDAARRAVAAKKTGKTERNGI